LSDLNKFLAYKNTLKITTISENFFETNLVKLQKKKIIIEKKIIENTVSNAKYFKA